MDAVEVNQKFSQLMNTNPLVRGAAAMGALHGLDANESLRLIVAALVEENERLASDNLRLKGIVPRGVELTPATASLDHIVAISRGGSRTMGNVQIVHAAINRMKGTLSNDDFVRYCRQVAYWADANEDGDRPALGPS